MVRRFDVSPCFLSNNFVYCPHYSLLNEKKWTEQKLKRTNCFHCKSNFISTRLFGKKYAKKRKASSNIPLIVRKITIRKYAMETLKLRRRHRWNNPLQQYSVTNAFGAQLSSENHWCRKYKWRQTAIFIRVPPEESFWTILDWIMCNITFCFSLSLTRSSSVQFARFYFII